MKRIIVIVAVIAMSLTVGVALGFSTEPADAAPDKSDSASHIMASGDIRNICLFGRPSGFTLNKYRHTHFGTANVVQCEYYICTSPTFTCDPFWTCWQYVWGPGVPEPWYADYAPVSGAPTHCW